MKRLFFLLLLPVTASAQITKYVPETPDPQHVFVLDSAHILNEHTIARIQAIALALQEEAGTDFAVVTLPTLGGRPIEEASLYLGRRWGVGASFGKGVDEHGRAMILMYVNEKGGQNIRVELGRGLEGTITDATSHRVINVMKPYFRKGNKNAAFLVGAMEADSLIRASYASARPATAQTTPQPTSDGFGVVWSALAVFTGLLGVLVLFLRRRGNRTLSASQQRTEMERQRLARIAGMRMERERAEVDALRIRARANKKYTDEHPIQNLNFETAHRVRTNVVGNTHPPLPPEHTPRSAGSGPSVHHEKKRREEDELFSTPTSYDSSSSSGGSSFGGDSGFSGGGSSDSV